jgi:hypothetical protein
MDNELSRLNVTVELVDPRSGVGLASLVEAFTIKLGREHTKFPGNKEEMDEGNP